MKRSLLRLSALYMLLLFCNDLFSQTKPAKIKKPGLLIGANFLYNSPRGAFADSYKNGMGGELIGGIGYGKTFLTATYGSGRFFSKPGVKDITYKPVKIGLRHFIIGKSIFAAAEVGSASINDKNKGVTTNNFIHAFGGGLRFAGLETGIYYNGWKGDEAHNFMQYKLGWNLML